MAILKIRTFSDSSSWQAVRAPLIARLGLKASGIEMEFFYQGLVVIDNAERVWAACVLYNNPSLAWQGRPAACFGNFDSENDLAAVRLLIEKAAQVAALLGKTALIGPMNGSTWGEYRLAIDGNDVHYLLDLQHPPYYPELLRQLGFIVAGRYATAQNPSINFDRAWLASAQQALVEKNLRFRPIDLDQFEPELERIYQFCMVVFSQNPLFTPISKQGFLAKYLPIKTFLLPQYIILCEDALGELCGLLFAVPNYADSKAKGMVVKTVAKSSAPQFNGLATVLCAMLHERMEAEGFQYVLHAFMEQTNRSNGLSGHFGGEIIKKYELFGKNLDE